jgi:hypothetical protein
MRGTELRSCCRAAGVNMKDRELLLNLADLTKPCAMMPDRSSPEYLPRSPTTLQDITPFPEATSTIPTLPPDAVTGDTRAIPSLIVTCHFPSHHPIFFLLFYFNVHNSP